MGDQQLCTHAMVPQVTIESVDDQTVSFWTRSGSKTGDPNERLRRLFTVPRSEIWVDPIPGRPTAVALRAGASGPLFLSQSGWATVSPDGFPIFGADVAVFKEPLCLGVETFQESLEVIPSKLRVLGFPVGTPEGTTEPFEIDLLGPDAAEAQDVRWNGADFIEIQLANATMKLWPTQIWVRGSAKADPSSSGEIDLLDAELASHTQHIQFTQRGTAISLVLTQDGFGAFHVIPGM
jgi:hypothetical protein